MEQTITFQISYTGAVIMFLCIALIVALCVAASAHLKATDAQDTSEELEEKQRSVEKRLTELEAKKEEEEKKE